MATDICFTSALSTISMLLIPRPPPPPLYLLAFLLFLLLCQRCSSHSSIPPVFCTFSPVFFQTGWRCFNIPSTRREKKNLWTINTFAVSIDGLMSFFGLLRDHPVSNSSGPRTSDSREAEVCSRAPANEETGGCGSGTEAHCHHW